MMAQLPPRVKRLNLVTLRTGCHPGGQQFATSQGKALYRRERDILEGIRKEAEIHHKALRPGKTWPSVKIYLWKREEYGQW